MRTLDSGSLLLDTYAGVVFAGRCACEPHALRLVDYPPPEQKPHVDAVSLKRMNATIAAWHNKTMQRRMNASGLVMNSSGLGMNSSGLGMNSSGLVMNSSGLVMNSSGLGMNASAAGMNSSGSGMNASGLGMNASGAGIDAVTSEIQLQAILVHLIDPKPAQVLVWNGSHEVLVGSLEPLGSKRPNASKHQMLVHNLLPGHVIIVRRARTGALLMMHLVGDTTIHGSGIGTGVEGIKSSAVADSGSAKDRGALELSHRKRALQQQRGKLRREVEMLRARIGWLRETDVSPASEELIGSLTTRVSAALDALSETRSAGGGGRAAFDVKQDLGGRAKHHQQRGPDYSAGGGASRGTRERTDHDELRLR